MKIDNNSAAWQKSKTDVFWGEIAPCEHVVQIYDNDKIFLDALSGFVVGGFNSGECVIVIATQEHLKSLNERLIGFNVNVNNLIKEDRYIPLDAEKTLEKFMYVGWPDEEKFMRTVSSIIARARKKNYKVRAFGEMVAILWAQGYSGATVQLEHLWNKFCETEAFCLFCAYPKIGFTQDAATSLKHICEKHSTIISGSPEENSSQEITYLKGSVGRA